MKFVSLHSHTSFSTGDAHGTPAQHIDRVKELGMTALAITEHGSVSSHVQLEKAALDAGIKPIFGVEAYVADPNTKQKFHQTILAMNENGYRQLSRLVTRSYDEGMYYHPTVHADWLFDPELTSDLIVLSGCADSFLSCTLAGGKSLGHRYSESELLGGPVTTAKDGEDVPTYDEELSYANALELVERYQACYGDRFYLEVQRFKNYFRTRHINRLICRLSDDTGVPLVATDDVHYPDPADWPVQRMLNCVAWGISPDDMERDYSDALATYPLTDQEMIDDLEQAGVPLEQAIEATYMTAAVADRCNVTLPKTPPIRYSESDGKPAKMLMQRIAAGIEHRQRTSEAFAADYAARKDEYVARLKHELNTIIPKDFSDYFLINEQIIGWAKDNGIVVGPGRGSAASSLVCYVLRITEINPMFYPQMVFERFLDPGRTDDPDVDTDYEDARRHEVFEYARSIYGHDHVGNIGNFSRYRGKTAIKAVAKALRIPPYEIAGYADLIADTPHGDPREFNTAEDAAAAFPDAQKVIDKYPELKVAWDMEGDMRTLGIHAAGMVISNIPISDTCAIYKTTKTNGDEAEVVAFDKRDAAYLNMLKLDCLGLKTMTIVADVIAMSDDLTLEGLYAMPFDDEKVLKAFAEDDLTGIFQFEGRATRTIVKDIFSGRPDATPTFMTLADINALSRPGSLISGMTARYTAVERGKRKTKIHPVVDGILDETNGCLVYQEQVMKIGAVFGGFDGAETSKLRKIIGAKQAGGAFEEFWIKFRDGAAELHGAGEAVAREVWDYMAASASYLFNISHSISYAAVAYWTMYLKVYYPCEFFAASLRNAAKKGKTKGKADPQLVLLQDAVGHGLTVSPPHPATAKVSWEPNATRTGVIGGFTQIPGVGAKVAERLIEAQTEGCTWRDLVRDTPGFGDKAAERAEAFQTSDDPFGIHLTNSALTTVVNAIHNGEAPLEIPNATSASIPSQDGEMVTYVGRVVAVKIIDVIGEIRTRQNKTTEEVLLDLEDPELATKAKIICADTGGAEVHVNVSRYIYPVVSSEIAELDEKAIWVVHTTGKANNNFGPAVQAGSLTAIELEE